MPKRKGKSKIYPLKTKKQKMFEKGQPVFCPMSKGIYWPGFVDSEIHNNEITIGFFEEENRNTVSISEVIPFDESNEVISASLKKITRMNRKLAKKFELDVKKATAINNVKSNERLLEEAPMVEDKETQQDSVNIEGNVSNGEINSENSDHDNNPDFVPDNELTEAPMIEDEETQPNSVNIEGNVRNGETDSENSDHDNDPDFVPDNELTEAPMIEDEENQQDSVNIEGNVSNRETDSENSDHDNDPDFVPNNELTEAPMVDDEETQPNSVNIEGNVSNRETDSENSDHDNDADFVQNNELTQAPMIEDEENQQDSVNIEGNVSNRETDSEYSDHDNDPDFVPDNELTEAPMIEDEETQPNNVNIEGNVSNRETDSENSDHDNNPDFVPNNELTQAPMVEDEETQQDSVNIEGNVSNHETDSEYSDHDNDPDFVPNNELTQAPMVEDEETQQDSVNIEGNVSNHETDSEYSDHDNDPDFVPDNDPDFAPDNELTEAPMVEDEETQQDSVNIEGNVSNRETDSEYSDSDNDPDFVPDSESSEEEMSDCVPFSLVSHAPNIHDIEIVDEEVYFPEIENCIDVEPCENQVSPVKDIMKPDNNSEKLQNLKICNKEKCADIKPTTNQSLPAESNLKPEERLEDINHPAIFTKRYEKNANVMSKSKRTYDRRHACFFCGKLKTNIQTHLEHAHKSCEEVEKMYELKKKICEMKEKEKPDNLKSLQLELLQLQTAIRNKGDNIHNSKVYANKKGEIILGRRRESNSFDVSKYGPCPQCLEWIILDNIKKHRKVCKSQPQIDKGSSSSTNIHDFTTGSIILQSKIMKGQITPQASKKLVKEVFPSMLRDNISDIAQKDKLIVALGDVWLMKNIGNKSRRKNFTSFRMRLAARHLSLLREFSGKKDAPLTEFLKPAFFDLSVECAYKACQENADEELKNPSTAIKLGYDLSRLASAKLGYCMKNNDEEGKQEATDFLRLIQMEWSIKVNRYAHALLNERHFNKAKSLPIPEDIMELASFMVEKLKTIDLSEPNAELFRQIVNLTEARLLLYNRRRPGELESLSVDAYLKRPSLDETELTLRQGLTDFEKHLLQSQDLVEIRGKTGRGVPVLIPGECKRMLEFLSDTTIRKKCGIKQSNSFMFANTGDSAVRAGDALSDVKERLKLKQPNRILATNLRKHTATIAQVLSLDEQEMKYLCNHLGHTQKIHDQYYRQTSGLIERIDIAKLMLIQEHNLVGTYANKKLNEIQFEDIVEDIDSGDGDKGGANLELDSDIIQGRHEDQVSDSGSWEPLVFLVVDPDFLDEPCRKKCKVTNRKRWTEGEEKELKMYFPDYFNGKAGKTCPTRSECQNAVKASTENKGQLWKRGWETIKKKLNNMLMKKKDQMK